MFPSTPTSYFWTSTTVYLASARDRAWRLRFSDGIQPIVSGDKEGDTAYVCCVTVGP